MRVRTAAQSEGEGRGGSGEGEGRPGESQRTFTTATELLAAAAVTALRCCRRRCRRCRTIRHRNVRCLLSAWRRTQLVHLVAAGDQRPSLTLSPLPLILYLILDICSSVTSGSSCGRVVTFSRRAESREATTKLRSELPPTLERRPERLGGSRPGNSATWDHARDISQVKVFIFIRVES